MIVARYLRAHGVEITAIGKNADNASDLKAKLGALLAAHPPTYNAENERSRRGWLFQPLLDLAKLPSLIADIAFYLYPASYPDATERARRYDAGLVEFAELCVSKVNNAITLRKYVPDSSEEIEEKMKRYNETRAMSQTREWFGGFQKKFTLFFNFFLSSIKTT